MIRVLHNNRCGKSRECLALLDENGIGYEIVDYLNEPLKFREIKTLLKKLKLSAMDIVRTNEPIWSEHKNQELSGDDIVRILARHPILIQRPIVINGEDAIIARPPQIILEHFRFRSV